MIERHACECGCGADCPCLKARVASRFVHAKVRYPDVVKGLIDYLKKGPFKGYLQVKSARGKTITLKPVGLNDQVSHIEITDLDSDVAHFILHLQSGDSGWAWDEWRIPPKFHNDSGYNVLKLELLNRIANPITEPEKFAQHMMSFCKGTLIPAIQKAGWVIDPATKKPVRLAEWEEAQRRAEAEKLERAERAKQEAAKRDAEREAEQTSLDGIEGRLRAIRLGPGGRARSVDREGDAEWTIEPTSRERLDHYVGSGWGSRRDEDDDPEGWDEEAWREDYADPMESAAQKWLDQEFGPGLFGLDTGDKGHLFVFLTDKGREAFR